MKHDKLLSKKDPAPHLRDVPEYLLDPTTQEARKIVKLARAAMGNNNTARRKGFKGKFRKSRDPLKTFSAEVRLQYFFWSSFAHDYTSKHGCTRGGMLFNISKL